MRSSPATRRGLALICLIAAVLIASWNWRSQHQPPPEVVPAPLPAPARTLGASEHVAVTELADPPVDPVFGQHAQTPLLRRVVEMYQHDPASPGGHAQRWADHRLDADAAAHRDFPIASADFFAGVAQWHGRWLSHQAIRQLGGSRRLTPDADAVPQNMLASFSISGDYLLSSSDPGQPQPGDLRISWMALTWPPAPVADAGQVDAGQVNAVAKVDHSPVLSRWRPLAVYLLALVLLLIAAGLTLGRRRQD